MQSCNKKNLMVPSLNSVLFVIPSFPPTSLFGFSVQFQIPSLHTFDTYSTMYVLLVHMANRTMHPIKLCWKLSSVLIVLWHYPRNLTGVVFFVEKSWTLYPQNILHDCCYHQKRGYGFDCQWYLQPMLHTRLPHVILMREVKDLMPLVMKSGFVMSFIFIWKSWPCHLLTTFGGVTGYANTWCNQCCWLRLPLCLPAAMHPTLHCGMAYCHSQVI